MSTVKSPEKPDDVASWPQLVFASILELAKTDHFAFTSIGHFLRVWAILWEIQMSLVYKRNWDSFCQMCNTKV